MASTMHPYTWIWRICLIIGYTKYCHVVSNCVRQVSCDSHTTCPVDSFASTEQSTCETTCINTAQCKTYYFTGSQCSLFSCQECRFEGNSGQHLVYYCTPAPVVNCGNPTTPNHGTVTLTTAGVTTEGATADQACNPGYDISGVAAISCLASGSWSSPPVTCSAVQCPKTIVNGQLSDSCSLNYGETCTSANCSYGYESSVSFSITCTAAGTWDDDTTVLCTAVQCPKSISNGQLSDSCSLDFGATCTSANCSYGYESSASFSITCTGASTWDDDTTVLCTAVQCPKSISNGQLSDSCSLDFGSTCTSANCSYGYESSTPFSVSCTGARTWDADTTALCTAIQCPRNIVNGQLSDSCSLGIGSVCTSANCSYGYENSSAFSISCSGDGTWDADTTALCTAVQCPKSISNGQLSDTCSLEFGATCTSANCSYGYESSTPFSINCTGDRTWDDDTTVLCTETFCGTSISNGDLPQDCTSRVDETCNDFTCISGYKRNEGVANLTCAESGQWSHDPSDLCIEIECPASVSNWQLSADCGVAVNSTCDNFTCASGYHRTQNVVALQCTENGTWNLNTETLCEETFCNATVTHGQLPQDCLRKVGESCINYQCDSGYKPNDGVDSLNCTESGDWNQNTSALCVEIHCPVNVSNGNLSQSCGTLVGDTCDTYSCDDGFKKNENVSTLSCTGSGLWDHDLDAICVEIRCPAFITNGELPNTCGTNIGDSCGSFNCNRGYQKQESSPLTCDATGAWTSNITQFCTEILCPGTISNGDLPLDCDTRVDDNCSGYTCKSGYQKNPNTSSLICTDTGSWNHDVSDLCTEILCPLTLSNGDMSSCSNNIGTKCSSYSCDQGFQKNEIVQSLTCSASGSWTYTISIDCPELSSGVSCDVDIPDGLLTESSLKTVEDTCSVSFCNGTVKQNLLNSNLICATTGSFVADSSTLCEAYACMSGQQTVHIPNGVLLLVMLFGLIKHHLLI